MRLGGTIAPSFEGGDADTLRIEARTLVASADAASAEAAEAGARARDAEAARVDAAVRAGRRRARPHQLARVLAASERLDETLVAAVAAAARFEAPLRAQVDAGGARTGGLGEELRRLGASEVELRQALTRASEGASAIDVEVARIEAEADEARRRLDHAGTDERAEGDDRDELHERAERLERRREQLGQVNPLAKEEHDAEKLRLDELATQRADLEASLTELEKLSAELKETVERRFNETFDAVQRNFHEVAGTLFPGGEGQLQLTLPEDDESQPGIEGLAAAGGQEGAAAVAALRRREGARRDLVPLRALPRAAVPVLLARRGRGRARRHEHRPLRRAAARSTPTARSSS